MADTPLRNQTVRTLSLAAAGLGVAVGLILIVLGIVHLLRDSRDVGGVYLTAAGSILLVYAPLTHALMSLLLKAEGNVNRIRNDILEALEVMQRWEPLVKTISLNSQISDTAKSIAHREVERDMLRQAIREEMYSGDWETAGYLIEEMSRRYGDKQEVQSLRTELAQTREMTIEEKISEAVTHIEHLATEYRWDRARMESERLLKLFPRHERVQALPGELNQRRMARKQELLNEWNQAVQRNEIDHGIAILSEIDQYLTREEAQKLQDSARHVFKAKLLNLGVQFSLAVSENRWRDALEIGLQIRQEFPNSRMAQEVEGRLDALRVRAGYVADAEVVQKPRTPAAP